MHILLQEERPLSNKNHHERQLGQLFHNCSTPTANLLTVKLMLNSIISTPNAKFMTIDLKDVYLNTSMSQYEYFRMKLELFPQDVINEYGLQNKIDTDGKVICKVKQGMYGMLKSGIPSHKLLIKRLLKAGYIQNAVTPGFWQNE